eukprot:SAG11_NODE_3712_length_2266_cov_16.035072_3_plen_89_part_00
MDDARPRKCGTREMALSPASVPTTSQRAGRVLASPPAAPQPAELWPPSETELELATHLRTPQSSLHQVALKLGSTPKTAAEAALGSPR